MSLHSGNVITGLRACCRGLSETLNTLHEHLILRERKKSERERKDSDMSPLKDSYEIFYICM